MRSLLTDQTGATAIEYALIAGLVVLMALGAMSTFGRSAGALFDSIATAVTAASPQP